MKNIPKIKTHTFYKKKYKVKFGPIKQHATAACLKETAERCGIAPEDIIALTDDRGTKGQTILISDEIDSDKELLRVLLDEGLHACDERIDNGIVDIYARDLANFLWRCGYRRSAEQALGRAK